MAQETTPKTSPTDGHYALNRLYDHHIKPMEERAARNRIMWESLTEKQRHDLLQLEGNINDLVEISITLRTLINRL